MYFEIIFNYRDIDGCVKILERNLTDEVIGDYE